MTTINLKKMKNNPIKKKYYSLWLSFAKKSISILYKTLPRTYYDRFYFFWFPRYQAWLRTRYLQRALRQPMADTDKIKLVYHCLKFSLVGWQGMETTYNCTKELIKNKVPGALVECGVARGGSALLIALVNQKFGDGSRRLWLFDSYQGLPDPTNKDFKNGKTGNHVRPLPKGSCLGTIEEVRRLLFEEHKLSLSDIELVKGWFQETLPANRKRVGPVALLRLDGDWYESTKICLETMFDQVSENGYVILDDYFSCYGCKRATDEFLAKLGKNYRMISDGRGGAYFQKIG